MRHRDGGQHLRRVGGECPAAPGRRLRDARLVRLGVHRGQARDRERRQPRAGQGRVDQAQHLIGADPAAGPHPDGQRGRPQHHGPPVDRDHPVSNEDPVSPATPTHPGTTQPGTTHPGITHAGTIHARAAHAGTAQAGTAHAGTAHAGTAHAGTAHAGTAHAGTAHAGTTLPGTAYVGTTHPDLISHMGPMSLVSLRGTTGHLDEADVGREGGQWPGGVAVQPHRVAVQHGPADRGDRAFHRPAERVQARQPGLVGRGAEHGLRAQHLRDPGRQPVRPRPAPHRGRGRPAGRSRGGRPRPRRRWPGRCACRPAAGRPAGWSRRWPGSRPARRTRPRPAAAPPPRVPGSRGSPRARPGPAAPRRPAPRRSPRSARSCSTPVPVQVLVQVPGPGRAALVRAPRRDLPHSALD